MMLDEDTERVARTLGRVADRDAEEPDAQPLQR
jgi:hypothetical protein